MLLDQSGGSPGVFIRYERDELEQSITDRFEKMVRLHPGRIAVKSRTGQLTYNELNQNANRIAWALLNQRGRIQEPVGLLVEEECHSVAAILAVLKSGRFYLPMNGSAPRDRFASRLQDSQVGVLITDRKSVDSTKKNLASDQCAVLAVDDLLATPTAGNPGLTLTHDAIAAIFYTSGSTGRPKGVIQNHRNVLHRVMVATNSCRICADDRLSLLTAPTYSASLRGLFSGLLNGAALYPFKVRERGLTQLGDWVSREGLTIYQSVPSVFRQWTSNITGTEDFGKLRIIILGGEATTKSDVELYKRHFSSNCTLICSLSSNETGLLRHYFVNKTTEINQRTVPAGYEIEDKEILILDENGQQLGFDQVGEIVVRSAFLSPGYWRQPDLTAAAFQPDPKFPEKTIYRTGDMGCLWPDGCLVYRGRKDFRAKISGIRVEMEEVEAALHLHPSVKEAVVVAREEGQSGKQRLVAYIIPSKDSVLEPIGMRRFLEQKLPPYMVPSAFVFLNELPHTPNGKIDRHALPAPEQIRLSGVTFVPPRDALEGALTNMWEAMLRVNPIGVLDNFFDLGGDSLAALQVLVQVHETFGKSLAPSALFQSPTVEQLAAILRQDKAPESWSYLVKLQSGKGPKSIFCILFSGGFKNEFFSYASLAPRVGRDYSFYGVMARGTDGVSPAHGTVEEMAAAYIREIKKVQPKGPYFVLGECFSAPVAYETAQQLRAGGENVFLGLLDARIRTHWYYKLIGRRLGARVRDHITAVTGLPTWNYLTKDIPAHIGQLRKQRGADRWRYVFKRLKKTLSVAFSPLARRGTAQSRSMSRNVIVRSKSKRSASHTYHLAVRIYQPRPYSGRIAVIVNEEWYKADPTLGWAASAGLEIYSIPGNHNTYLRSHIQMVADVLRTCLEKFERE
jgi:amino acid adenylation domain-containing protein